MANNSRCTADYEVRYYNRSHTQISRPSGILTIDYGRRGDDISSATIVYSLANSDCCNELGDLEPIANNVGIYSDGEEVWYGVVKQVSYDFDTVTIRADDAFWWMSVRKLHYDHKWINTDLTDIFIDLFNDAMSPDPISGLNLVTLPSHVKESRTARLSEHRTCWAVVREMLDTGLDVTAYGRNLVIGPLVGRPLQLRLSDVQGQPSIIKNGELFTNNVTLDASDGVVGIYPPGNAAPNTLYPLVEKIIKDSQVQGKESALAGARSRYEFSRVVPRIVSINDGLQLQPNTNIVLSDLIPGVLISVDTTGLCYEQRETFRLGSVDVSVGSGAEQISMALLPTGPLGTLDTSLDAVE